MSDSSVLSMVIIRMLVFLRDTIQRGPAVIDPWWWGLLRWVHILEEGGRYDTLQTSFMIG